MQYGVPELWWTPLGLVKATGALGLLIGLTVPVIGRLAGIGLVLYFLGAIVTVLRAGSHNTVAFPVLYLAPQTFADVRSDWAAVWTE